MHTCLHSCKVFICSPLKECPIKEKQQQQPKPLINCKNCISKNNETHEYQGQSVQPEYHASLTEDHSFPLTPLTYNYDSNSTDSQFNSFNQPTTEIDFPDINEPDGHIPLITKEEINKDIAEAIKVLKDTSKYVRENGSYEELLKFSNHTRDFTLNVKKLLLNNP